MPNVTATIRRLADAMPTGAVISLTKSDLLSLIDNSPQVGVAENRPVGYSVEEVAAHLGRSPTTIRHWCKAGLLANAWKLRGKQWRIPASALESLQTVTPNEAAVDYDLGAWRRA